MAWRSTESGTTTSKLADERANLFLLSGHDDGRGVFANMGLPVENRNPLFASRARSP